eukprot:TRINITY_DN10778_c0_g1_i2.p1 TRINITY_DN10778_c0_g1~~TRINITY_DN10778_c0_g1_i2.p1  ORF type:complete len:1087 (+),score=186.20 TRINITY_DN10778_c0_g1_i2:79-3339(+)
MSTKAYQLLKVIFSTGENWEVELGVDAVRSYPTPRKRVAFFGAGESGKSFLIAQLLGLSSKAHTSHCEVTHADDIGWIDSEGDRSGHVNDQAGYGDALAKFVPDILYACSDVIVVLGRTSLKSLSYVARCLEIGGSVCAGRDNLLKPALVIVQSCALPYTSDSVALTTSCLVRWQQQDRVEGRPNLSEYFDQVHCVQIPMENHPQFHKSVADFKALLLGLCNTRLFPVPPSWWMDAFHAIVKTRNNPTSKVCLLQEVIDGKRKTGQFEELFQILLQRSSSTFTKACEAMVRLLAHQYKTFRKESAEVKLCEEWATLSAFLHQRQPCMTCQTTCALHVSSSKCAAFAVRPIEWQKLSSILRETIAANRHLDEFESYAKWIETVGFVPEVQRGRCLCCNFADINVKCATCDTCTTSLAGRLRGIAGCEFVMNPTDTMWWRVLEAALPYKFTKCNLALIPPEIHGAFRDLEARVLMLNQIEVFFRLPMKFGSQFDHLRSEIQLMFKGTGHVHRLLLNAFTLMTKRDLRVLDNLLTMMSELQKFFTEDALVACFHFCECFFNAKVAFEDARMQKQIAALEALLGVRDVQFATLFHKRVAIVIEVLGAMASIFPNSDLNTNLQAAVKTIQQRQEAESKVAKRAHPAWVSLGSSTRRFIREYRVNTPGYHLHHTDLLVFSDCIALSRPFKLAGSADAQVAFRSELRVTEDKGCVSITPSKRYQAIAQQAAGCKPFAFEVKSSPDEALVALLQAEGFLRYDTAASAVVAKPAEVASLPLVLDEETSALLPTDVPACIAAIEQLPSATLCKIVREIVSTEIVFLQRLTMLAELYENGLYYQPDIVTPVDHAALFKQLTSVRKVSRSFLIELLRRLQPNPCDMGVIANVFITFAPEFRRFAKYCVQFHQQSELLSKLNTKPMWQTFDAAASQFCGGQNFSSLYILPVQRVPRYVLLLNDLLKEHPKQHNSDGPCQGCDDLLRARSAIAEVASRTNSDLRVQDSHCTAQRLEQTILGTSLSRFADDPTWQKGRDHRGEPVLTATMWTPTFRQERELLLFEDVLVVLSKQFGWRIWEATVHRDKLCQKSVVLWLLTG